MQTYARVGEPSSMILICCRFGLKRRFVATMEWLRLWPNPGFLAQITHTLDTTAEYRQRIFAQRTQPRGPNARLIP